MFKSRFRTQKVGRELVICRKTLLMVKGCWASMTGNPAGNDCLFLTNYGEERSEDIRVGTSYSELRLARKRFAAEAECLMSHNGPIWERDLDRTRVEGVSSVHIMSRAHIVLRLFTTPFLRLLRLVNCVCEDGGTYNIDIDRPDTSGAFISGTTPRSMSLSI